MKRAFALLQMTPGLCAGLGTGSAAIAAGQGLPLRRDVSLTSRIAPDAPLTLIDDEGDEGEGSWCWPLSDDDGDCGEDDDDEGGGDCSAGAAGNAAKAGTAPPPRNGLFTDGTVPMVKSN